MHVRLGDSFDRFEIAAKWAAPVRRLGIEGVRRGKRVRPTVPDSVAACPRDLVKRHCEASESVVGSEPHLLFDLAGMAVCRLHHLCLRQADRRLEGLQQHDDRLRSGCAGAGRV